jgi:hypothetical protein
VFLFSLLFLPAHVDVTLNTCSHLFLLHLQLNKIYIGGLPEHTRREDLQNCFGKLGEITNIELK